MRPAKASAVAAAAVAAGAAVWLGMPRAVPPEAGMRSITLAWECRGPAEDLSAIVTGIEGSVDLVHWVELTNFPAAASNVVTLRDRPAREFYRAFNRWKMADGRK